MVDGKEKFAELLKRYQRLGKADRKAVLASFSPEERTHFERAANAEAEARREEELSQRQADRQFLCYSPPIAAVAEAAVKGADCDVTPRTLEALAAVHEEIKASQPQKERDGWAGLLDRVARVLAPPARSAR